MRALLNCQVWRLTKYLLYKSATSKVLQRSRSSISSITEYSLVGLGVGPPHPFLPISYKIHLYKSWRIINSIVLLLISKYQIIWFIWIKENEKRISFNRGKYFQPYIKSFSKCYCVFHISVNSQVVPIL